MNKKDLKFHLAPIGVAFGITVFITASIFLSRKLRLTTLTATFPFIPRAVIVLLGLALLCVWIPVFVSGIYFLNRKGAVGQSEKLVVEGIYKYVRNPMYSGISFTIIGVGLVLNATGVALAGFIWLLLALFQAKREEKELSGRFGQNYIDYEDKTPMFIPHFGKLVGDAFSKPRDSRS